MFKKVCLFLIFISLLAACNQQEQPNSMPDEIPSGISSSIETNRPEQPENESHDPNVSNSMDISNSSAQEVNENEFFEIVNKVIIDYENGIMVQSEAYPPLPEGFLIPKNRSAKDIDIVFNETIGDYRITIASADGKWDMVLFANKFIFVSAESTTGGELQVTDVVFVEK
ncbi:hypothetical protein [Muricomes intestini]|uniref:hypothetical protein n=1 Tax=Muricomes intestini TaxID=1796634 RepID=UPI002FE39050